MKTLIIMAAFVTSFTTNAQFYAKTGLGENTKNSIPVAALDLGYETNTIFVQGGMMPHLSNKVKGGTILSAKAGHSFGIGESFAISPAVGYGAAIRSSDKTNLNSNGIISSICFEKSTRFDPLKLYAECTYFDKSFIFNVGIKLYVISY